MIYPYSLARLYVFITIFFFYMPALLRIPGTRISLTFVFVMAIGTTLVFLLLLVNNKLRASFRELDGKLVLFSSLLALFINIFSFLFHGVVIGRTLVSIYCFIITFVTFKAYFGINNKSEKAVLYLIAIGVILNFIAIILERSGIDIVPKYVIGDERSVGLFAHPNQLGMVLCASVPIFYAIYLSMRSKYLKSLCLFMLFISVVGIIFSGSKTNIMFSVLGLSIVFLKIGSLIKFTGALAGASGIFLIIWLTGAYEFFRSLNPRLFEVIFSFSNESALEYRTMYARYEIWEYSFDTAIRFPLTGEGMEKRIFDLYSHSHNFILEYMRVFGFPGFFVSTLFVFSTIYVSTKALLSSNKDLIVHGVAASSLIFILANMMSDSLGPQTYFVLSIALAYLTSINEQKSVNQKC